MRSVGSRLLLGRLAVMGPIAFTIAWIVGAVVQDEYSLRREDISALAALDAQNAWIMVTGFLLLGVGIVALGAGLAGALNGRPATVGSILVAVAGVGIIVAGLARNDCSSQLAACADRVDAGEASWHHVTHDLVSLVVFLALVAAALVFARAFRGDQSWRDLRTYCLITAVLGLVLLVLFITGVAGSWNGLLQRVFVTVLFLWIAVLGARLIRLSRTQSAEPAT
ncbi:DUF998 domain-containing protein [Kribbella sp. NBC_01510]|uniref:DUF998 domain-containing protein n=1 Tax=Kribbella sp. NBC_01510 TaxID=2903581 RepID=UPI00386C9D60